MPGLVRKLLIYAAVDGLVLQPLAQRGQQRPAPATKIAFKDNTIGPALREELEGGEAGKSFESFGIIGMCPRRSISIRWVELARRCAPC